MTIIEALPPTSAETVTSHLLTKRIRCRLPQLCKWLRSLRPRLYHYRLELLDPNHHPKPHLLPRSAPVLSFTAVPRPLLPCPTAPRPMVPHGTRLAATVPRVNPQEAIIAGPMCQTSHATPLGRADTTEGEGICDPKALTSPPVQSHARVS